MTNINSTLMCPSKVPVMTILEPENVAISIKKLFWPWSYEVLINFPNNKFD